MDFADPHKILLLSFCEIEIVMMTASSSSQRHLQ